MGRTCSKFQVLGNFRFQTNHIIILRCNTGQNLAYNISMFILIIKTVIIFHPRNVYSFVTVAIYKEHNYRVLLARL